MKILSIIAVFTLLLVSCNKLNENNIRGNWEIEKFIWNGGDSTAGVFSYMTFNEGGGANYTEEGIGTIIFNWQLDKKGQVLSLIGLFYDTNGNALNLPFNVDKKGKKMTLTYEEGGASLRYELKQVVLDY